MAAAEMATINETAFQDFLRDHNLLSREFTAKDVRKIFVRVNLDDELHVQEDKNDSSDGLTLDEFEECLVRVCVELAGERLSKAEDGSITLGNFVPRLCALVDELFPARRPTPQSRKAMEAPLGGTNGGDEGPTTSAAPE